MPIVSGVRRIRFLARLLTVDGPHQLNIVGIVGTFHPDSTVTVNLRVRLDQTTMR